MTLLRKPLPAWMPALALALGPALTAAPATGAFRHGLLWYSQAAHDSIRVLTAERYEIGITGLFGPSDVEKVQIKTLNPDFRWFVYNSGSDNFVPPHASDLTEYETLSTAALVRGLDPEILYLHYSTDTWVLLEGDTVFVPGWGAGSAAGPEEARVPVYLKSRTRCLVNFSDPRAAQLHKQVMVGLALDVPFTGTSLYPDGIFLDNTASLSFSQGTVLSGGRVLEVPGNPVIGTAAFQTWWWTQNLGPFLTSLKDTLQTSSSWSADGKQKLLTINVANVWDDTYASWDVADILFLEFQYNAVRVFGLNAIDEAFRRDRLAAEAGIVSFYSATMTRSVAGRPEYLSLEETMLANLAWFLITRTPGTVFYQQGTNAPNTAAWDSLTWIGAMDVADSSFGEARGDPYTLAEGTDPLGNPYLVKAREYEGGFAVLRNRGNFNQGIEEGTAVLVNLPRPIVSLAADGTTGAEVASVTLRNGQGALFIDVMTPVRLASFTATRDGPVARLAWEVGEEDSPGSGLLIHREGPDGERLRLHSEILPARGRGVFVDAHPPAQATRYWISEVTRAGGTRQLASALLPARPGGGLSLVPAGPNPVRLGTPAGFRFEVPASGTVSLAVFDLTGREVNRLVEGWVTEGSHTATWTGSDAAGQRVGPGLYVIQLRCAQGEAAQKLLLLP